MARDGHFVIDCHHHVGGVPSLMGSMTATPAGLEPGKDIADDAELAARLQIMDDNGVDQCVVMPTHEYLRPNGQVDNSNLNDAIVGYRKLCPERFVAAVGIVEPLHGSAALDELERIADQGELAGVSFHTRFQGVSMDSYLISELVRKTADVGLVPFVHVYADSPDETPWKILDAANSRPDTPMVILDGFSGFERIKEISRLAEAAPNLVFDTSLVYSFDFVTRFAETFGPERVVFGTDLYSVPLAYRHSYTLDQVMDSELDHGSRALLLSGNIRRILNLAENKVGP